MSADKREIGLNCWRRECRNSFSWTIPKGMRRRRAYDAMEGAAGREGWVIGHFDGQGHYACAEHADTLWDPIRLRDHGTESASDQGVTGLTK